MNTLGTVRDLPHGIFGGVKHHLFLIDCCVRRDQLADLFLCSLFSSPLGIGNRLQNLPHSALTRAAETTLSPSSSFMILTPWVFLPITPTPEIGMRMIDPCCETTITSSLSDTHLMATTAPILRDRRPLSVSLLCYREQKLVGVCLDHTNNTIFCLQPYASDPFS